MPAIFDRQIILRHWPKSLPRNQDRSEVRIFAIGMLAFFVAHLLEPAVYAANVESSTLFKVVSVTGHAQILLTLFFACVLLMLPHLISLIFMPRILHCRTPRVMACAGAVIAALLWFVLANTARPLDYGVLPYIYAARSLLDLIVAGVIAWSLNSQQIRENAVIEKQ